MNAFRLHDYRLFCADCTHTCDVKATDENDAAREARKVGWVAADKTGEVLCPLCIKHRHTAARQRSKQLSEECAP